jgi:hypothetical protein
MRTRQRSTFTTIVSEGALLPVDLLQRIALFDANLGGIDAEAYHHAGEKLNEVISDAWTSVLRSWRAFDAARAQLPEGDSGLRLTRERWLLALFDRLGYGRLYGVKPIEIEGKSYDISHGWQHLPIHLVSFRQDLDHIERNAATGQRSSPYSLVQELLNRSPEHLWGLVSNGLSLRLLRKNASLTRLAYVEFDLEAMLRGESYADFALLWLLCHQSRVEGERASDCWLEQWAKTAQEQGVRALEQLRKGVEQAINALGSGFLAQSNNQVLKEKLRTGTLSGQAYYNQVLRLVYRLLILFVAEDREILFDPQSDELARQRYSDYYSTARLRRLASQRVGTRHADLFHSLWLVMEELGSEKGCPALGLPALNGFLFSSQRSLPDLIGCELENHKLLDAVRALAFTLDGPMQRNIDYKNLGAEELGSVYESLLELHPEMNAEAATFALTTASGNDRKTSGSYYTPTSLIDCLLDSALMPVLAEARKQPNPEKAILALKVCDPACGSGHFLIAAAHRIARVLAAMRTGTEEPGPIERRAALRDVVAHCIYGVDINPMAVELCKVSLWMEAIEPGKPLSFLDAHIKTGNSLLGATPKLLRKGIPDEAFEPIEGDDKKICSEFKKLNNSLLAGQQSLFREDRADAIWEQQGTLMNSTLQLEEMREDTVEEIHRKEQFFVDIVNSGPYANALLWANAWCAAFVWKKTAEMRPPITDEEFRDIGKNPFTLSSWRKTEIERLAAQYQFFHWHLAFPEVFRVPTGDKTPENEQAGWSGGFDVVLGNPPWERIKIQEKEWFAVRRPAIANAANASTRRKMIAELQTSDKELYADFMDDQRQATGESHFVRDSARYPLCGHGDVNTYAIFAENMRWIVGARGRVGCIVPSGIATDDTTKFFFQGLTESQSLVSFFSFINEAKLFPGVDHRVIYALLAMSGLSAKSTIADFAFGIYRVDDLKDVERHFSLSASDIALLNPNTRTCPIFRSKRDMEVTKAIYKRVPVLIKEGPGEANPWDISFKSMFHMTNDSHLFCTQEQLAYDNWKLLGNVYYKGNNESLPLYEAKMISTFNPRFGTYEGQTQAQANQGKLPELDTKELANPNLFSLPKYWIHKIDFLTHSQDGRTAFLCFRDITRSTDARTAIFSLVPAMPCGNNLPILLIDAKYTRKLACLAANLSSFVFDFVARQKVGGTHMNFFIVNQLPAIPPQHYTQQCVWDTKHTLSDWITPRALELTYTAWDLEAFAKDCGYDGPPFRWDEERRFLLRCELDAAYFHLYGIARDDVDYIMDTFRVWREKEIKQYHEYRTKRVILEIYDEMQQAIELGEAYRTRLEPGPADPAVAHPARVSVEVVGD